MKRKSFLTGIFILLCSSILFAQQPIVFKLAFTDPPYLKIGELQVMHHSVAGMVAFKAAVENMTQKRVIVENYFHGRLGDANENLRQILAGTLQGATPADGAVAPSIQEYRCFRFLTYSKIHWMHITCGTGLWGKKYSKIWQGKVV